MSFKVLVKVAGEHDYHGNALRFSSLAEADAYATDLRNRWVAVETYRLSLSEDEPNRHWTTPHHPHVSTASCGEYCVQ